MCLLSCSIFKPHKGHMAPHHPKWLLLHMAGADARVNQMSLQKPVVMPPCHIHQKRQGILSTKSKDNGMSPPQKGNHKSGIRCGGRLQRINKPNTHQSLRPFPHHVLPRPLLHVYSIPLWVQHHYGWAHQEPSQCRNGISIHQAGQYASRTSIQTAVALHWQQGLCHPQKRDHQMIHQILARPVR